MKAFEDENEKREEEKRQNLKIFFLHFLIILGFFRSRFRAPCLLVEKHFTDGHLFDIHWVWKEICRPNKGWSNDDVDQMSPSSVGETVFDESTWHFQLLKDWWSKQSSTSFSHSSFFCRSVKGESEKKFENLEPKMLEGYSWNPLRSTYDRSYGFAR